MSTFINIRNNYYGENEKTFTTFFFHLKLIVIQCLTFRFIIHAISNIIFTHIFIWMFHFVFRLYFIPYPNPYALNRCNPPCIIVWSIVNLIHLKWSRNRNKTISSINTFNIQYFMNINCWSGNSVINNILKWYRVWKYKDEKLYMLAYKYWIDWIYWIA